MNNAGLHLAGNNKLFLSSGSLSTTYNVQLYCATTTTTGYLVIKT